MTLYLDTSAVLRATLERGTDPEIEKAIQEAPALFTSRLSIVEVARALLRLRATGAASERAIAEAERQVGVLWRHCEILDLTPAVCDLANYVAPGRLLRTLDALHLATFVLLRRRIERLEMLTADQRLGAAAAGL